MRQLLVCLVLLSVTACGGGGGGADPINDFDPTGHWLPVGAAEGTGWEIRATGGGVYILDYDEYDLVPMHLTVDGNSYSINGEEWDLTHRWHAVTTGTGSFSGDTMAGTWVTNDTDTQTGEIEQSTYQFTATRDS